MNKCVLCCVLAVLAVVIALVVGLSVGLTQKKSTFEETFIAKCKKFPGSDCPEIFKVFQQAFVGKDPCDVPPEAYDPLLQLVPFPPACNRLLFWSKTKDVAHAFTKKNYCYQTVEDTLLGSVLDNVNWCGEKGSSEIFTDAENGCPTWNQCENNPVRSFWMRISAAFAESACGKVQVLLNADIATPFQNNSVFGSVELKKFRFPKVKGLTGVLVRQTTAVSNCNDPSLKILRNVLDSQIKFECKEVTEAQLMSCKSTPEDPCTPCW